MSMMPTGVKGRVHIANFTKLHMERGQVSVDSRSGELEENSVISILETTAADDMNYKTKFYKQVKQLTIRSIASDKCLRQTYDTTSTGLRH